MNLKYKGRDSRGKIVWSDEDHNLELEEWQVKEYRRLVVTVEKCIGRKLTTKEARTLNWLSSWEEATISNIIGIIIAAHENGKGV